MTIDERLAKLVERQQALDRLLELLAKDHQRTGREIRKTEREIRALGCMVRSIVLDH
jgi:hypothetical protein